MAMEKSRLVEIGSQGAPAGTGYLIGGKLALTTAHVLRVVADTDVALRRADSGEWVKCRVVWRDDELDAALLEQEKWNFSKIVKWGTLVGSQQVNYTLTGFPAYAQRGSGRAEIEQLTGQINPLSGSISSGWLMPVIFRGTTGLWREFQAHPSSSGTT
ncbi:hypothetical protein ACSYGO_07115 [Streptomyces krungchingensis]